MNSWKLRRKWVCSNSTVRVFGVFMKLPLVRLGWVWEVDWYKPQHPAPLHPATQEGNPRKKHNPWHKDIQPSPTHTALLLWRCRNTICTQIHTYTHTRQYLIWLNFRVTKGSCGENSRDAINTNCFMKNVIRWVCLGTVAVVVRLEALQACRTVSVC